MKSTVWTSSPPLVAAVLIAPKGVQSPGSGRVGGIGDLVYFFPSEAVQPCSPTLLEAEFCQLLDYSL